MTLHTPSVLALALLALTLRCPAQGPELRAGTKVVLEEGAELSGRSDVGDACPTANRVCTVVRAEGRWLLLAAGPVRGWVAANRVMTLDRALGYFGGLTHTDRAAWAYGMRGRVWIERGEYDIAIADLNESLRLDPTQAWVWVNRGNAHHSKKEYDRAIADYDEAIRLEPRCAAAYNNRGNTAWYVKRFDRAFADCSEAIRLDPKDQAAYNNRGNARRSTGDIDGAIADYDEAIRLDPTDALAHRNRGDALWYKGAYDRAIAEYTEAIRLDPKNAPAYANRGNARHARDEPEAAIRDYDEAIRLDPRNTYAYRRRGDALWYTRRYDRAIADYGEAIRLKPESASAYWRRAWVWATCPEAKYRDGTAAIGAAARACELTDWRDADSLLALAAAYAEAGDFVRAVEHQEKAITFIDDAGLRAKAEGRLKLYRDGKPFHGEPGE